MGVLPGNGKQSVKFREKNERRSKSNEKNCMYCFGAGDGVGVVRL